MTLTRLSALLLSLGFTPAAAAELALVYDNLGICNGCAGDAASVRLAGLTAVLAGLEALNPDRLADVGLVVVGSAEETVDIRRRMTKA